MCVWRTCSSLYSRVTCAERSCVNVNTTDATTGAIVNTTDATTGATALFSETEKFQHGALRSPCVLGALASLEGVQGPPHVVFTAPCVHNMDSSALPSFLCPIGREIMRDPVTCADGHSYERDNIERWLATHNTGVL